MRKTSSAIITPGLAALVGVAALIPTGCGRNHLGPRDGGAVLLSDTSLADAGSDVVDAISADARTGEPRDTTTDLDAPADLPPVDAPAVDVSTAQPDLAPPFSCASLAPLVARGVLFDRHAKQVRVAPDGRALLFVLAGDDSKNDEAWVVGLPDGERRRLRAGVQSAQWFGHTILVTTVDADVLAYSGAPSSDINVYSPIAHKVCGQATSPDGSRVYFVRDCTDSVGDLYVMDLADGSPKKFATAVYASGLVVSPGGRWAAYVRYTNASDVSPATTKVHVVGNDGTSYVMPIPAPAYDPYFVSDDLLLAEVPTSTYDNPNLWSHRPGSDSATLLTSGNHGLDDYAWNADGSAFLVAQFPPPPARTANLFLTNVTDGSSVQLASDLIDHRMFEMRVHSFDIAPTTGRVIYVADTPSDGGRAFGAVSLSQRGGDRIALASNVGTVVVSPFGDRVAILTTERTSTTSAARVTVVSPTTGSIQFAERSSTLAAVTFVPGDRGLVFAAADGDVKTWQLRFLSFATGTTTTLAGWNSNVLMPYAEPLGIQKDLYPIDPSGCFVPVDSDLAPSGTSLVLLPQ